MHLNALRLSGPALAAPALAAMAAAAVALAVMAVIATALCLLAASGAQAARVPFEYPMDTCTQEIEVEFTSSQAAGRARIAVAPLYDGREWAITSRWDDANHKANLQMRDLFAKYGCKATYYLTETQQWFGAPQLKELLRGGNAVAGHSLTHSYLAYQSRNRIFEEIAGVRADLEAASDSPVVSFGFAFLAMRSRIDEDAGQIDIARMLERAGYYHLTERWFHGRVQSDLLMTPWMPPDGQEIDGYVGKALADGSFKEKHPCMAFSMHAGRGPDKWAQLELQLQKYSRRPEWWYCTQNEYAAYRWQVLKSRVTRPQVKGKSVVFGLTRPALVDLNDAVPLTFEVRGVPHDAVRAVRSATAECVPAERRGEVYRFHVHHDRDQGLPAKIGLVHNRENRASSPGQDPDLPGVRGRLSYERGSLRLVLENRGPAMTGVRVTYRLPLAFREGVVRRDIGRIAAGRRRVDTLKCTAATRDYKYLSGSAFFAAQVDFLQGRSRGRIYCCCNVDNRDVDRSFPQGGFLRLGPVREADFDLGKAGVAAKTADLAAAARVLGAAAGAGWVADEGGLAPPFLDPEVVKTTGSWYTRDAPAYYLLRSTVTSPAAQPVGIEYAEESVLHVFLNGARLGSRGRLARGANLLVLVYKSPGPGAGDEKAGAFVRLTTGRPGDRLKNIRFEAK